MKKPFFSRMSWLALAFFLLVLAAISWISLRHNFNEELTNTRKSAEQQVQLIASIITSEMNSGHYQDIDEQLNRLAKANDLILELRLDAANGFNLASYKRSVGGNHSLKLKLPISYSYHGEATFSARVSLDEVYQTNKLLGIQIAGLFTVLATLLSFLLYMAIRLQAANFALNDEMNKRKEAQENLLKINETLEERVNERTAALAVAKDEAERANRIKSDFLSHMSHEFRTPLNAILGFTQLIEMDALAAGEDNTIENVHDVLKSGRHLLALVNDVLDFTQLGIGKLKTEPSQTNLLLAAIDSIGAVRTLAKTRKIEIRLVNKLLENHGEIWADPLRTKQVLLNLLSNAIKYNKEGGSIEVALETLNSEFVRLFVKDSGIGIPEESIGELFRPFSRLHTNSTTVEGAGIGLSITKDLVEMMGGRIDAKSVSGVGTTFWIDMPTYTGQMHAETGLFLP